jgi:hypothetical protein
MDEEDKYQREAEAKAWALWFVAVVVVVWGVCFCLGGGCSV